MSDYSDPAKTLLLLGELEECGFSNKTFSILHHFERPHKIATHRKYCESLCEKGKQFRTSTNELVQRRLEKVLYLYRAGRFTVRSPALFEYLANAVLLELPHGVTSPKKTSSS